MPVQEWSLTIHLRCERTLPGHAPGMTSRTSHCRVSPARPYSTSLTAQPHARHLQPKWQLLPHVYPSGSNCGATSIASDSQRSLSQSNPSWPSQPFNKEQVISCPVDDFRPKSWTCLKSTDMRSQCGAVMALAIQTLAYLILINHIDMPNMQ